MTDTELDVRTLRKPDKHPTIFATYNALGVGEKFVLVNNHDPRHLHDEFEAEVPESYGWEYLGRGPKVWRIQISRLDEHRSRPSPGTRPRSPVPTTPP